MNVLISKKTHKNKIKITCKKGKKNFGKNQITRKIGKNYCKGKNY